MKTIQIPLNLDDRKFEFFPAVTKEIFKAFYNVETLVEPKDHSFSFYYYNDKTQVADLVKSKIRIDMPKTSTFMIDKEYVNKLKKAVKNKSALYHTRGLLAFPVINEHLIYFININKLSRKMLDTTFVKNTYSEEGHVRQGEYYYIPKEECQPMPMKNIEFVITKDDEYINKEEHKKTNSLL